MSYNQWYKIRLEGCIGQLSKLYIDDVFICDVEAFKLPAGVTLNDLTYVYLMAGSNSGIGDECYIDDIKLMSFEPNPLDSFTAALGNWALDVQQSETIAVSAFNEKGEPISDVNYAFESADPGIASVDGDGVVTGVSPGSTMITVTASKGAKRLTHELTVMVYSDQWDTWDFEDCDVGGELPEGFSLLAGNLLPSVSDAEAYQSEKSLHFHDTSTSAPASLKLTFDPSKAAVLEYMFYPVESVSGIWLGMGSEKAGNYLSNILFDKPVADSDEMRLRYNADGWKWVDLSGMTYNNWYKIRLEGHVGMPSKLYIDDQFICEVGPYRAANTLENLTYVYFMGGSNSGIGDNFYIDDIKLMNFDADTDTKAKLSDLTFDGKTIPGFSPDVLVYDIELPAEKKDAAFDAIAVDPESAVSIQRVSENLVIITVGSGALEQVYTINITWKNPVTDPDPDLDPDPGSQPSPTPGGGGGSSGATTYAITVNSPAHGTVELSDRRASSGDTVTVTVTPDSGYELNALTVTDAQGNKITVTAKGGNVYIFTMPQSSITVTVAFTVQTAPTMTFTDVDTGDWFYEAVQYAYGNGMMNGVGNNLFAPSSNLTRSMIAQVLYNLEGTPVGSSGVFTDVAAGQWYADAVNWAAANDIVGGYGNGKFGPEDDITREQMAQILYNYATFKGYDVSVQGNLSVFNDGATTSDWALSAMKWAVGSGLLQGYNGNLNPIGTATRAEVAQILMNFCENIAR